MAWHKNNQVAPIHYIRVTGCALWGAGNALPSISCFHIKRNNVSVQTHPEPIQKCVLYISLASSMLSPTHCNISTPGAWVRVREQLGGLSWAFLFRHCCGVQFVGGNDRKCMLNQGTFQQVKLHNICMISEHSGVRERNHKLHTLGPSQQHDLLMMHATEFHQQTVTYTMLYQQ